MVVIGFVWLMHSSSMGGRVRVPLVLEHLIACVLDLGVSMRDRLIKVGCIFWTCGMDQMAHLPLSH